MKLTLAQQHMLANDMVAAVILRHCVREARAELEIAIGFKDWASVKHALDCLEDGLKRSA